MQKTFYPIILIALISTSCGNMEKQSMTQNIANLEAPVAEKKDSVLEIHDNVRVDPYFWMRLTDEQKNAENPDEQTQKVLDYLNAENDFTDGIMAHTKKFRKIFTTKLLEELKKMTSRCLILQEDIGTIHAMKKVKNILFIVEKKIHLREQKR